MEDLIIVGGGASGMAAAIAAARAGAKPVLLEGGERVGKKILSTGNGKCNYTNLHLSADCYRSASPGFPMQVLRNFDSDAALGFFRSIGIVPYIKNGYVYPRSEQASAVLDALRLELDRLGVMVCCGRKVSKIQKSRAGFQVFYDGGSLLCRNVILSAGGCAAPKTGSDGSGFRLAEQLGHRVIPPFPALVQLRVKENFMKSVAGVRTQARVHIYVDGREACADSGEVQLTDYGISGIPVFQVSRYASAGLMNKKTVRAELDFLPEMSEKEAECFLRERKKSWPQWSDEQLLLGVLPKKLAALCAKQKKDSLIRCLKHFSLQVTAANSFEQAQVSAGGVDAAQIDARTCQSKRVPGLYFTGELLDVDGICGGYNLHWAWATGILAGTHAAGKDSYAANQ